MSDVDALVAFLRARLDEDEQWALAASAPDSPAEGNPQIPAEGLHWQWGVGPNWDPVEIDPAIQEFVDVGESCVLISVETWQTRVGTMPRCYGTVEEMDAAAAGHIARHDPARVLREVEAKRRRLDRHARITATGPDWCDWCSRGDYMEAWPCPDLANDALPYTEHEDFKPEWRQLGERTEW